MKRITTRLLVAPSKKGKSIVDSLILVIGGIAVILVWKQCYMLWKKRYGPSTPYLLLWKPLQNQWYPYYRISYIKPNADRSLKITQLRLTPRNNPHSKTYLVYFPSCSTLQSIGKNLTIKPNHNDRVYFFRACYCRQIHSKLANYSYLTAYYGSQQKIMPISYRLDHFNDYSRFQSQYKETQLLTQQHPYQHPQKWLVKLDIDQKRGLYLYHTLDKTTLQQLSKQPALIQLLQPDPLLINGYRSSFRFYLAIHCQSDGRQQLYLYSDGLVQYSMLPYDPASDDLSSLLAGYPASQSTLKHYIKNRLPRSYQQLLSQYNNPKASLPSYQTLLNFFQTVFRPFRSHMCECKTDSSIGGLHHRVHVYGADVGFHLDRGSYRPYLYELNTGPQQVYQETDRQNLILTMYRGLFQCIGILPKNNHSTHSMTSNNWIPIAN